jgi:tetratricopeptide (TPR) repeat protein
MKKIIFLFVMLFVGQITFSQDKDLLLKEARKFALNVDYNAAIKSYKSYVKLDKKDDLKEVYFELANCYFKSNDTKMAVKTLKTSIKKYGLKEEDLIYSQVLDAKLSDITIAELYNDFTRLRNRYVTYQERH